MSFNRPKFTIWPQNLRTFHGHRQRTGNQMIFTKFSRIIHVNCDLRWFVINLTNLEFQEPSTVYQISYKTCKKSPRPTEELKQNFQVTYNWRYAKQIHVLYYTYGGVLKTTPNTLFSSSFETDITSQPVFLCLKRTALDLHSEMNSSDIFSNPSFPAPSWPTFDSQDRQNHSSERLTFYTIWFKKTIYIKYEEKRFTSILNWRSYIHKCHNAQKEIEECS